MSPYNTPTQHHHTHYAEPHELPSPHQYPPYDNTSGALIPQTQNMHHESHYHQPSQPLQVQSYAQQQQQQPRYYDQPQPSYERQPSHHSHHSIHSHHSKHSSRDVERRPTIGDTLMLIYDSIVGAITGKRR